jgi:hypothetical protein
MYTIYRNTRKNLKNYNFSNCDKAFMLEKNF